MPLHRDSFRCVFLLLAAAANFPAGQMVSSTKVTSRERPVSSCVRRYPLSWIAFYSSSFKTAIKASVGSCTVPRVRIFFLPSFCFSNNFFFRLMSPP